MEQTAHTMYASQAHVDAGAVAAALQIVCAWCQRHMVWHRVLTPMPFPISYSICTRCYTAVTREFTPLTVGAASPGLRAS